MLLASRYTKKNKIVYDKLPRLEDIMLDIVRYRLVVLLMSNLSIFVRLNYAERDVYITYLI